MIQEYVLSNTSKEHLVYDIDSEVTTKIINLGKQTHCINTGDMSFLWNIIEHNDEERDIINNNNNKKQNKNNNNNEKQNKNNAYREQENKGTTEENNGIIEKQNKGTILYDNTNKDKQTIKHISHLNKGNHRLGYGNAQ